MSEIITASSNEALDNLLHGDGEHWHFGAGDPEFWRFSNPLVVPGGNALDLGAGEGRSSLFFLLNGMDVTAIESDPYAAQELSKVKGALNPEHTGALTVRVDDMFTAELDTEQFDTVLLAQNLVHVPSKEAAFNLINRSYDALIPGGHIWIRTSGKASDDYEQLRWIHGVSEDDDVDVFEELCGCSGQPQYDPILFLSQTDLLVHFAHRGARIVHSESMPQDDQMNIMYGKDFNWGMPLQRGGMITLLAQKPHAPTS